MPEEGVGITYLESNIMVEVLAKYSSFSEGTRITIISDAINNLYETENLW